MLSETSLSFAQEEIWQRLRADPTASSLTNSVAFRISGRLDVGALRIAARQLAARQPALRTTFVLRGERVVQLLAESARLDVPVHDLAPDQPATPNEPGNLGRPNGPNGPNPGSGGTGEPDGQLDQHVQVVLDAERRRPFDLSTAPLLRCAVFRLTETDWILLLTAHRLICDSASVLILLRDLAAGYARALGAPARRPGPARPGSPAPRLDRPGLGRPGSPGPGSPAPRLDRPGLGRPGSADYSAARRPATPVPMESRLAARAAALTGAPSVSAFRGDLPRPRHPRGLRDRVTVTAGAQADQRLAAAARRFGVPEPVLVLAVFALFVHRQTGQPDIVFGTPSDLRGPDVNGAAGQFTNILTIRSTLLDGARFPEHLRAIAGAWRLASNHRDVPLGSLVRRLGIEPDPGRTGLVQLALEYRDLAEHRPEFALRGLQTQLLQTHDGYPEFEFRLLVEPRPGEGLRCTAEYDRERFSRAAAARLLGHFQVLLEGVLADSSQPIAGYPLTTAREAAQLRDWNDTAAEFPADTCLHELIEGQARRTPDATAVVCDDEHLSYLELDQRANQLARLLIESGAKPDDVVGICLERSAELVVGLLAILKAGAGYLPLDPGAPPLRLARIVADAGAAVCLTRRGERDRCPQAIRTICLDPPGPAAGHSTAKPAVPTTPLNLVSVYYTSGSTGAPKGVASTHRGWVNRMVWMQRRHQLRPGETVLHKTTLTFDDSALELFWPLSVGGCVAMLPPDAHRDPEAILEAAARHRTVHLQTVPSMLAMLLDTIKPAQLAGLADLRCTVSSGEALSPSLVRRFGESMPGRLHNTWGATEVSIDSTDYLCGPADAAGSGAVSVGLPFDNNQVYVLDPALREVPAEIVGDLYLGGVGLARGYLGDPARTAVSFVASPFQAGERMYRTGDLGYRRADGSIMFVGRQDFQVKIRGMRVELGEIESALRRHPHVAEAVVTVQRTDDGQQWLAGYVSKRAGRSPSEESLREHLSQWLPAHMRPSALHVLDRMPLNANGKIDRSQLSAPAPGQDPTAADRPSLTGQFEPVIASIWQEVMPNGQVGPDSNFFDVGGQSLTATRVVTRVRRRYGIDLPLRELFRAPVLRDFSAEVERRVNNR
jgi:amino acid adenylation domain-containing protein